MSNGGYKGSTPARETSPEQYPGVWELTEQFQAQADGNWPFQETDCAPKSLRFNSSDSAYLSRTPASAGNRKTWTWSGWVKLSTASGANNLFAAYNGSYSIDNFIQFYIAGDSGLSVFGTASIWASVEKFRDPSAWYHFVIAFDTTQSTADDRLKVYVNNSRLTKSSGSGFSQNTDYAINNNIPHRIGTYSGGSEFFNGLMADVHFIDGQALAPTDFGFFDGAGIWQPKRFTGDYSSGPVYSNFITASNGGFHAAPYHQPAGFNNVIGTGSGGYVQAASGSNPNNLTFTPSSGIPYTNSVEVYIINAANTVTVNGGSAQTISANQWVTVASGSGVLTSLKFERPSTSGASFSGIKIDGQLLTDASVGRNSFHLDFADNSTAAALGTDTSGNGNTWTVNNLSIGGVPYSSYITGADSTYGPAANVFDGNTSTDWISTAHVSGGSTSTWTYSSGVSFSSQVRIYVKAYSNDVNKYGSFLVNGTSQSPSQGTAHWHTVTGITSPLTSISIQRNDSGTTYGTHVFAVEVDGAILVDGAPSSNDSLVDSPTNGTQTDTGAGGEVVGNYCTWNPLYVDGTNNLPPTFANGNLDVSWRTGDWNVAMGTIKQSSGKWYWEITLSTGSRCMLGITKYNTFNSANAFYYSPDVYVYFSSNGNKVNNNTQTAYGASFAAGDVIGVALDLDAGTLVFYKNGASQGTAFSSLSGNFAPVWGTDTTGNTHVANFGQRPFAYTAPSGYKALCTTNLPEPTIADGSKYFDTKLWTGNSSTQTISGYGFSPDFAWIKVRSEAARSHFLFDRIRGATNVLKSDATDVEQAYSTSLTAFNSDGFDLGAWANVNNSTKTIVGWAWDAGEATTTIAAGSLNSSAYDQSQTWSNLITPYLNSPLGTGDGTQIFDGSTSTQTTSNSTSGAGIKFTPTSNISGIIELWLRNGDTANSTFSYSVDGGSNFTNVTTVGGSGSYVNIGQQTITTTNGLIVRHITTAGTNSVSWRKMRVSGKELVDSGVTPTNVPSIASTVRANPSAGFSIVTATGNSGTVGHGLGVKPSMVIVKQRTSPNVGWAVTHSALGTMKDNIMYLNGTGANTNAADFWGSTEFSSTIFSISSNICTSGADFVAYCFAPVEGYSAMGSYTGNGSDDGPFVFTGFRPRFILTTAYSSNSNNNNNWNIHDTSRNPFNEASEILAPNNANIALDNSHTGIDILSNGFKLKGDTNGQSNFNGWDYIYYAVAEHPFKTARAR